MGNIFKLLASIFLIMIVLILGLIYIRQNTPVENFYLPSTPSSREFSLFGSREIKKIIPPTPTKPLIISFTPTSTTTTTETTSSKIFETTTISETQLIEIIVKEYKFEPDLIKVKAGEKVSLRIRNEGLTPHDFKLSDEVFSIKSDLIPPGQETELNFILPKKGIYEFYCTLHIDKGMKGKIIAE